jgi:FAD/FMN-containing dehydrogenase
MEANCDHLTRRGFLAATGVAAAALGWAPAFAVTSADAASPAPPPGFPAAVELYRQAYRNWDGEIRVDNVWTCAPTTPEAALSVVNWAYAHGWQVRACGMRHGWAPLTIPTGAPGNVVLIDTTRHLTSVTVNGGDPASVTAQTGVTMDALFASLEAAGYGVTDCPAPGDLSLGGVLAIGGHGSAVPASGETRPAGHTYGSISNLILSLTAVVWDAAGGSYVLRTFERSDADIQALMVHVGRSFVTSATLRVGANQRLRCLSSTTIGVDTLFAPPATAGPRSFASFVEQAGRVETIWFPFTPAPWLKVWSVAPVKPPSSREVHSAYNYVFADVVTRQESELVARIQHGDAAAGPELTVLEYTLATAGLVATDTLDLWGWSKNTQLYVKPTTMLETANGYNVLTARANIQRVVSELYAELKSLINGYAAQGRFPVNGQWEVRVTGLDDPAHVAVPGALPSQLSVLRSRSDHPEWDTAVWFDVLTIPGSPDAQQFYYELEQWMLANYTGSYATVRPEWSKGWAYSGTAGWANPDVLGTFIPNAYRAGQAAGDNWDTALATLLRLDPHRVFDNAFLTGLLG